MYQLQVLANEKMRYYEPSTLSMARWKVSHEIVNPNHWIVDLSSGEIVDQKEADLTAIRGERIKDYEQLY